MLLVTAIIAVLSFASGALGSKVDPLALLSLPCQISTQSFLSNKAQFLQLFVSSGRFPGDAGNYFSCTIEYGAQFCTIETPIQYIGPNLANDVNKLLHDFSIPLNYTSGTTHLTTGMCFPQQCNVNDMKLITEYFYYPLLYNRIILPENITQVTCLKPHALQGAGAIITVIIAVFLVLFTILGTAYRPYMAWRKASRNPATALHTINGDDELLVDPNGEKVAPKAAPKIREPKSVQLIKSFDLGTNFNDLLKSPAINNGLKALDALRVCSMVCYLL
jgi:hypothetical protein